MSSNTMRSSPWRDRTAVAAAIIAPLAVAVALVPFRTQIAHTDAALILVLVVVAVAANGYRLAGLLTALSAGVWFDFFLTPPYEQFAIAAREDIETTVLLLLVGMAVTELAVWGRRQHAEVSRREGYEAGIRDAAASFADKTSTAATIDRTTEQLTQLLELSFCRFDYGAGVLGGRHPRLRPDGQVQVGRAVLDVDRLGLPTDEDIELLVMTGGTYHGRFLMQTAAGSRPTLTQRLVAAALADRAGAVLAGSSTSR